MPSLTRAEARVRSGLIDVDAYRIELDVTGAADGGQFGSTTTVRFRCRTVGATSFVELRCAQLIQATLNGVPLDPATRVDNRLPLPELAASNELVVVARMAYSNTGEGLHRFVDPADGEVYLYAQTFLDEAQRVFACFDQPDLKAPVTMIVAAPPAWEVAANGPGRVVAPGRWEFVTSQPLATYFVSVVAGPYHVRRDIHDGIPLAVYCRRALAAHLDKDLDEILTVTRASLDHLHDLFGVRYPFDKFDQAFVPEFNAGAMENAALVVLRDEFLFRSAVADDERETRAVVIAHELSHMWFGDLVTMRWWDDLWLNESFAEYLGFRVLAEATRFTGAWTGFAVGRKGWGYAADQRPSTHPVAPEGVADCASALLNFDGISYAKGAAVLRQLAAWLGDDVFLDGLRAHVRRHAYGNASLDDLLGALAAASGRDLSGWAERWLRRPQVNTVRPEAIIGPDGCYESVVVTQTAPASHPTLRPQRIGLGVYSGGSRQAGVLVDLDPDRDGGRTPVPELAGTAAGLLLLNDGDLGYAKIRFDDRSRAALATATPGLTDPLARALIWGAVVDAVRDADMPATDFVDLFVAGIASEAEVTVVRDLVRFATARAVDAQSMLAALVARFLPSDRLTEAETRVARACLAALAVVEAGAGRRILLVRGYVAAAGTGDLDRLRGWLDDPEAARRDAVPVDAEMRWAILTRLAALGVAGGAEIEAELSRDRSASGMEHAARCRAARPDLDAKAAAWRTIMEDDHLSGRLVTAAAEGLWHPGQVDLMESYVERYFTDMPRLAGRRTSATVAQVAGAAFPRFSVRAETVDRARSFAARTELDPTLRRVVIDHADELRRSLAGRRLLSPEGVPVDAAGR